jgi:hypothetical protein
MQPQTTSDGLKTFDESGPGRILIVERIDGGRDFTLPAARNFKGIMFATFMLAVFAFAFVFLLQFAGEFMSRLPWPWARFIAANIFLYPIVITGVITALVIYICGDAWLRASRVIATANELRIETRWWFVKRLTIIPVEKIIRTRTANNTTINDTHYYDIEMVSTGEKPSLFFKLFPPTNIKDEVEAQRIRTGGKSIRILTNIQGQPAAEKVLSQLREALKITV